MRQTDVPVCIFVILLLFIMLITVSRPSAQASSPAITAIKAGETASMALDENGNLWYWGSNFAGEGGSIPVAANKSTSYIVTPIMIKGINNVIDMDGGTEYFTIALDENHMVWTWGSSLYYNLGREIHTGSSIDPMPGMIPGLAGVKMVTAGADFCTVLLDNGTVWSWGLNNGAQLGDGTVYTFPIDDSMGRLQPGVVVNLSNVRYIASGERNVIAITNDGELWLWGSGSVFLAGEYGKAHYSSLLSYGRISTPIHIEGIHDVQSVTVGEYFAVALKSDGSVWTWGANFDGQLGTGSTDDSYDPVQVQGLNNVVQVSAGLTHAMALTSDGTVWTWGWNQYGQLGDGTTTEHDTPVKLDLPRIVAISANGDNSMALDADGNVWTWGSNNFGELGNGEYVMGGYNAVPEKVTFPDVSSDGSSTTNIPQGGTGDNSTPTPTPTSIATPTLVATPTLQNTTPTASITPSPAATTQNPSPSGVSATPGFGFDAGLLTFLIVCLAYKTIQRSNRR